MMYSPTHYREDREDLIFEVIQQNSFATLISIESEEPFISHLPLLLDSSRKTLKGHCAKANPHWKHFRSQKKVTAVFHGPHAYVSPAWYQPKNDNVPTWNYVAVHIVGTANIIEDATDSYRFMQELVSFYEKQYGTGWSLPEYANDELNDLSCGIVTFEIAIEKVEAKFKLSQKQELIDRNSVISNLPKFAGTEGQRVAEYMKRVIHE